MALIDAVVDTDRANAQARVEANQILCNWRLMIVKFINDQWFFDSKVRYSWEEGGFSRIKMN